MIFRLLDFAFRVVGSFFFVFLLQFQFDGRSLESYLNDFGKKFVVTKTLKKVSQDGSKVIKGFLKEESAEETKQKRETASQKSELFFNSIVKRVSRPSNEAKDSKE